MFTLSGRGMDLNAIERDLTAPDLFSAGAWRRPAKFATHRDARGRFELSYPQAWELEAGEAVVVRSKSMAAFARVDTGCGLQEALVRMGGTLTIQKERDGRLQGTMELNGTRFEILACAYLRGTETIVLTTGAAPVSPALRHYAVQVLTAVRREFSAL